MSSLLMRVLFHKFQRVAREVGFFFFGDAFSSCLILAPKLGFFPLNDLECYSLLFVCLFTLTLTAILVTAALYLNNRFSLFLRCLDCDQKTLFRNARRKNVYFPASMAHGRCRQSVDSINSKG